MSGIFSFSFCSKRCGIGWLSGLLAGTGIALSADRLVGLAVNLSLEPALMTLGRSLAVGLFFGIAPVQSVARFDLIVALRYK